MCVCVLVFLRLFWKKTGELTEQVLKGGCTSCHLIASAITLKQVAWWWQHPYSSSNRLLMEEALLCLLWLPVSLMPASAIYKHDIIKTSVPTCGCSNRRGNCMSVCNNVGLEQEASTQLVDRPPARRASLQVRSVPQSALCWN